MTGARDTQWTDLITEETVALVELVNSIQNGTTDTSHTMNTGEGKADKPLAERMKQKGGEEATDVSLRTGTTRVGRVETSHHRGNGSNKQKTKTQA